MIKEKPNKSNLPENPIKMDRDRQPSAGDSDYYINTTVQAMVLKYGGRRKGKEIALNGTQYENFLKLQEMFGKKFTLNEIICAGYYLVKKADAHAFEAEVELPKSKQVSFKPTEEALYAVAKIGGVDAFDRLVHIGLLELSKLLR